MHFCAQQPQPLQIDGWIEETISGTKNYDKRAQRRLLERVKKGDLIVADKNFGCGSSREHAPIAIKAAGVSCVIADTFARIFYRNAINIGLPIIECPDAAAGIEAGDEVEVDFDTGIITNKTKNTTFQGQPFPEFMQKIIASEGLVNYINQKQVRKKDMGKCSHILSYVSCFFSEEAGREAR